MSASTKYFLFVLSCFVAFPCLGQERTAINHIKQKKWSSVPADLAKAFRKDTLNPEAKFLFAQYYLSEGNPAFNIDSSLRYTQKALVAFSQSSPKQKDRLRKIPVDSISIIAFRSRVDSAAFANASKENTVASYDYFIDRYFHATRRAEAIELRDEVAYVEAMKVNTPAGFKKYVDTYPNSRRAKEASDRYEQFLFNEQTRIFESVTSSGTAEDFQKYIGQYPTGEQTTRAKNILAFLEDKDDDRDDGYLIPFLKNDLYGFMNDDGEEVMAPQFKSIDSTYLCGNITSDFIVTSSGVYSRSGALLLKKTPTRAAEIGKGFLNIIDGTCQTIVHQSGFQVGDDCVEDAHLVADQFIALKKSKGWNVYAFNGKPLLTSYYEGITNVDKLIILKRYSKNIVVRASQVAAVSAAKPLDESLVFDEVRAWGEGNLWVKNGVLEGVIGQDLGFVIPLDRQLLVKTSFGFTTKKGSKVSITGTLPDLDKETYDGVNDFGDWVQFTNSRKSSLYRVSQKKVVATNLDSVWIKNKVAFGLKGDSLNVYVNSNKLAAFERTAPVTFIKGGDSVVYFWVSEKKGKTVFEASQGKKLFSSEFDDIEVIGNDIFLFSKKNKQGVSKKGLFRRDGKIAQPAEYDAIIPSSNGYLSLLKDKKFGLYNVKTQKLIKPVYERNVLPYGDHYFVAYKGGYGIITEAELPVTGFDFEEIRYWNDDEAWVKKNFLWSIISIKDNNIKLSKIRAFQYIKDRPEEKIVRVQQENYYGIVSNKKGVVVSPTFTEVLNIGSVEKPFYFTEKNVEEADIFVVIYYNSDGKLVRKQVYEAEEYEKIYCEN